MLSAVSYSVTFATTGRTLEEDITFRSGFGILTGANETGKSFAVEMIRWCLFGSAALRGKIGDYKTAKARLTFSLKGDAYAVERTASNAILCRGEDEIAVGTTAVNRKVCELFGFGLDVFDASCVALQGEIEALGLMKPAERKRLVDSVIGLGVIDELGKSAGDEANALKRRARDLSQNLREPEPPARPDGYRPLSELDGELAELKAAKTRLDQLRGQTAEHRDPPTPPVETITTPAEELGRLAEVQDQLTARLKSAELELKACPEPSPYSEVELAQMEAQHVAHQRWVEKERLLARAPDPGVSVETVKAAIAYQDAEHLRVRIAELEAKGVHVCPACAHEWPMEASTIDQLKAELAPLADVTKPADLPEDKRALAALLRAAEAWSDNQADLLPFADVTHCERPSLGAGEIERHRHRNSFADRRKALSAEIAQVRAELEGQPDHRSMLRERQRYEDQLAHYDTQVAAYADWEKAQQTAKAEISELDRAVIGFDALFELRNAVAIYDTLRTRYEQDLKTYTEAMESVSDLLEDAEDWDRARAALTNLRSKVKQHLIPSLNAVASQYLSQMTGGERSIIHADEDFTITVDGQALNTLSGSGKAVACLALRLGLGQVLTQGVFPVFIGDEIDASMDQNRTANTAALLDSLKSRLSQILLVTHKRPEADYVVEVGK
ncbi:SMC family ATPase [uncultured Marivita sp.]|uniref:ATP-binding protein n=1 Tax=uncultured Marivita sp. TaxID=888080 RepID=UPI0026130E48|nr:SMC family ATPase [uncultured Marivita sp.]